MSDKSNGAAWYPDQIAADAVGVVYEQVMPQIDTMKLSVGIPHGAGVAIHEGEGYADALIDLTRLIEEARFETAMGALYAAGVRDQLATQRAKQQEPPASLGFSNKARAILSGIIASGAPPLDLITNPNREMPGMRVLGGWWAAQLYDSALMRGVAVLDRLVTLLYYVEGLPVDPDWTPAFRRRNLVKLRSWVNEPEWADLLSLLDNELFDLAKGYRDGLIHRTRYAAELHGDFVVGRFTEAGSEQEVGFGADVHFGIVQGFYNEVMTPAVRDVAELIARTMKSRGYDIPED